MHTLRTLIAVSTLAGSAIAATLLPISAMAADTPSRCSPQLLSSRTDFPLGSQAQGQHGLVRLSFTLNTDGHAAHVDIAQSSGHKTLDRAAAESVRNGWQFDVSHCTVADLSTTRTVDVTFRRATRHTLAGSLNAKAVAEARSLASNAQCHQTLDESGTAIFACVKNGGSNLANALARK